MNLLSFGGYIYLYNHISGSFLKNPGKKKTGFKYKKWKKWKNRKSD